jgi:hypothetical protein
MGIRKGSKMNLGCGNMYFLHWFKNYRTLGWMTQNLSHSRNKQQFFCIPVSQASKVDMLQRGFSTRTLQSQSIFFSSPFSSVYRKNQVLQTNSSSSLILAFLQEILLQSYTPLSFLLYLHGPTAALPCTILAILTHVLIIDSWTYGCVALYLYLAL